MIDLKIEDFKPEFAGKMNFYLSVVDDQLRDADDAPTIGIILCKGRNEIIVEYALRDANKPMGVAHYQLANNRALPEELQADLPTVAELSKEFPLLSVVKVRIEIEKALNEIAKANDLFSPAGSLSRLIVALVERGLVPPSAAHLLRVLNVMNGAAHGVEMNAAEALQAIETGNSFLAELRKMQAESAGS